VRRLIRRISGLGGGSYAVIERDFLVTTSSWRFLGMRLAVAFVAALVVAVVAMANHDRPAPDEVGRLVFGAAVVIVPILVLLMAPGTAAPAISSEREGATLDLVLVAPVSALTFVLSKFVARFLAIAVLVFAMLPVAAVCFLYGGVPGDSFLALIVFCLTTAAFCVATGLAFSSFLRNPAPAVLGSLLFVLLAPPVPLAVLALINETVMDIDLDWVDPFLPLQTFYVWGQLGERAFRGGFPPEVVWHHAAVMAGVSAILLGVTTWRMRRESRTSQRKVKRRLARGLFLGHPLLDRGVRGSLLWHPRRRGFVLPALALTGEVILLWAAIANDELDEAWVHVTALGGLTVLGCLRMLSTTSASLSSERKRGSLELLLATPYRPRTIAYAVLLSSLLSTGPLFLLGLLHGTVAAAFGALHPLGVAFWTVTSPALLVLAGAIGLRSSASASSATRAALGSFGTFFGGVAVVLLVVFVMAVANLDRDASVGLLLSLPPVLPFYAGFAGHHVGIRDTFPIDRIGWEAAIPAAALGLYAFTGVLLTYLSGRVLERRGD
jgi:ABC-type transport system involved in multi-copper enzyme maturation permease subunit